MLKTIVRTTACLAVSAAAFIVITKMDATAAKPKSSVPEEEAAAPVTPQSTATKKRPKQPPPRLEVASLRLPATTAPAAATTATTQVGINGLDSTLTVPDWKGKRLSVARREARKLGFNVTATDENGESVPADAASGYRVRRQLIAAGTPIEPGADIELRVREIAQPFSGY